jgi:hypothetical protein
MVSHARFEIKYRGNEILKVAVWQVSEAMYKSQYIVATGQSPSKQCFQKYARFYVEDVLNEPIEICWYC